MLEGLAGKEADEAARLMVRGPGAMGLEKTAAKVQLERMDVSSEGETRRYALLKHPRSSKCSNCDAFRRLFEHPAR